MLFPVILFLAFVSGFILPWWVACIFSFAAAIIFGKGSWDGFWSGFGGLAIAWAALALLKSFPNEHILATRVASLFHIPHWGLLLAITVVIGGLAGGMSALSGVLVKRVFEKG
ncbi:hypothetical protein [Mucilaginibacter glaciei]|uniref:Uncharacterized protein n=1 Tax=Mucilaginibacter glaciei TaxID=2772109 RepID=A0A926NLP9_9SPHI|nr:hypothetical protein [Mucilaginibacter glaciei]MBD1394409.1 hypothetical protein [Mucilaginibacter glaciei]